MPVTGASNANSLSFGTYCSWILLVNQENIISSTALFSLCDIKSFGELFQIQSSKLTASCLFLPLFTYSNLHLCCVSFLDILFGLSSSVRQAFFYIQNV